MVLQLNLTDPISVSSGDLEDLVFVQINLSQLSGAKDLDFPENVIKSRGIPP